MNITSPPTEPTIESLKNEIKKLKETNAALEERVKNREVSMGVTDPTLLSVGSPFELLVSSIKDYAIFLLDSKGRVASWNVGAKRLKGYEANEIIGKHFSTFYPEEDKNWKPAMELDVVNKEGRFEDEGWRIKKDGSLFWANVIITALRDKNGELVGYAKVTRDLTERKKAEKALKESEQRYMVLVESVKDYVIIMLDKTGHIISWNAGAEKIQGYRADDIIGKHFSLFYTKEDLAQKKPDMELEIAKKYGKYEEEGWRVRKDGTRFWANVMVNAMYNDQKELMGFSKVTRDLTERKMAEEMLIRKNQELAASNVELEQFAYIASHDLQEPLRTVATYVQLLDKTLGNKIDWQTKEYMEFVRDGAYRMKKLIDDLLEYARVGKTNLAERDIDLNKILDIVKKDLVAAHPDAEIIQKTPLPVIHGTELYMLQLFQNLIGNGIKFKKQDQKAKVEISVKRQDDEWLFCITDNGIGIDPQYSERIFYIFQRLHNRQQYSGSGIGLAICKKIIDLYNGRIWMQSEPGKGTTFFFTLPAKESDNNLQKRPF